MQNDSNFDLDQLFLENVTLFQQGHDPILKSVDFQLPTDQTVVIESSHPQNAVNFLKFIAGQLPCFTGRLLWNGLDVFSEEASDELVIDPRQVMGTCFEQQCLPNKKTVEEMLLIWAAPDEVATLIEDFELTTIKNKKMNNIDYGQLKLIYLVISVLKNPQILILEDPANALTEKQWLMYLDFVQFKQRRGYLRHIFLTNHQEKALHHLEHNKIYLEEGLIYIDETMPLKKVAHF